MNQVYILETQLASGQKNTETEVIADVCAKDDNKDKVQLDLRNGVRKEQWGRYCRLREERFWWVIWHSV